MYGRGSSTRHVDILKERGSEELYVLTSELLSLFIQWGHFEVAKYHGKERDQVLRDFTLGRLDVGTCSFL